MAFTDERNKTNVMDESDMKCMDSAAHETPTYPGRKREGKKKYKC